MRGHNMFLLRSKKELSLNYPRYPLLTGALGTYCLESEGEGRGEELHPGVRFRTG